MNNSVFEVEVERRYQEPIAGMDTTQLERNALLVAGVTGRARALALATATSLGVMMTFAVFLVKGVSGAEVLGFRTFVSEVAANASYVMFVGRSPALMAAACFLTMIVAAGYAIREN